MSTPLRSMGRSLSFALWSLRRSTGQMLPVGIAFLLLVGAIQVIGTLHDVSSALTRQQISRSWRNSYDLFVRPQSSVSQAERASGWIDPQSLLEDYGGISDAQIAAIRSLSHVTQVMPFATVGWQGMNVVIPISLVQSGVYRITARWNGQQLSNNSTLYYVDVTDLNHLLSEPTIGNPIVQHLLMHNPAMPVVFSMPVPAVQAVVGIPTTQQSSFRSALLQNTLPSPSVHLSLSVEKLTGGISSLPACTTNAVCWQPEQVQEGSLRYQSDGVQLLRYSATQYSATAQQIAAGQVSVDTLGFDGQGPLYRTLLAEHIALTGDTGNALSLATVSTTTGLLPLTGPEHLPLLPTAVRFIPLAQACSINGPDCYSGLYIRLNNVDHYNQQSLALLQATAAAITARTGLYVDILDGSSTRTVSIVLPANTASASLSSTWPVVGVAVQIVHGVDTLQETLLALCSFVCLLAIGAAGVLIGIGRRKEVLLLQQVGWSRFLITLILLLDALILCLPGFLLAAAWSGGATILSPASLSPIVVWSLLVGGVIVYCAMLTRIASSDAQGDRKGTPLPYTPDAHVGYVLPVYGRGVPLWSPWLLVSVAKGFMMKLHSMRSSKAFHTKVTAPFVCAVAVVCAVFLIAEEYLLVTDFNQVLIVTILGKQVREALEGPQLALLLVVIVAALLTVSLCTSLQLRGQRFEFSLLAMVGWERKFVLQRILWASWLPALLSGEVGALLALFVIALAAAIPAWWVVLALIVCGPLVGIVLVSIVTIGLAWQETGRVFA
jgi:hypothetical protein